MGSFVNSEDQPEGRWWAGHGGSVFPGKWCRADHTGRVATGSCLARVQEVQNLGTAAEDDLIEPGFGHSPTVDETLDAEPLDDSALAYEEILEEDSSIEDPVKMYLHEIGRGQLLTADDEKWLACRLEEASRLKETISGLEAVLGRTPTPAEVIAAVYARVYERRQFLAHIAEVLAVPPIVNVPAFLISARLRQVDRLFPRSARCSTISPSGPGWGPKTRAPTSSPYRSTRGCFPRPSVVSSPRRTVCSTSRRRRSWRSCSRAPISILPSIWR